MGCRNDYQEPNAREIESKAVANHIVFVGAEIGWMVPAWINAAAGATYGNPQKADELTQTLCLMISEMPDALKDRLIYNGRDAKARKLADWWDAHQAADKARADAEIKAARLGQVAADVIADLTEEQKEAIRTAVRAGAL